MTDDVRGSGEVASRATSEPLSVSAAAGPSGVRVDVGSQHALRRMTHRHGPDRRPSDVVTRPGLGPTRLIRSAADA